MRVAVMVLSGLLLVQAGWADTSRAYRTTDSDIAVRNLDFTVERSRRQVERHPADVAVVRGLLDLLLTRAQFLGTFSDYDEGLKITARLLEARPTDPDALLERIRILERLHRFDEALALLANAKAARPDSAARVRARIALARGGADGMLADAREWAEEGSFSSLSLLAFALHGLGLFEEAERAYLAALEYWDQVSPFAIAWNEFQRGELYVGRNDARAATHFGNALSYLPDYVTARVHLAELIAEAGDVVGAIALLEAAGTRTEDPEVASRHAEFLALAGRHEAAIPARLRAERGYAALLERHPLAFLDHAAEFWLGAGDDPERAWQIASTHLDNGPSERALALAIEAGAEAGRPELCALVRKAQARHGRFPDLDALLDAHAPGC